MIYCRCVLLLPSQFSDVTVCHQSRQFLDIELMRLEKLVDKIFAIIVEEGGVELQRITHL